MSLWFTLAALGSACVGEVRDAKRIEAAGTNDDDAGPEIDPSTDDQSGDGATGTTRRDAGTGARSDAGARDAGTGATTTTTPDAGSTASAPPYDGGLDQHLLGAYCANTASDVTQFETWLGRPVDGILAATGSASWSDYDSSVIWAAGNWAALNRRLLWSVPLIPTGATLADAAAGMYDDHYTKAAQTIAKFRPQEPVQYIRTGWEFNGSWAPWSAVGKAQDFIGAFQHFVAAFRAVSPRFRFEWNVNVGDVGMDPTTAYPGDDSVDIIGMDFYWKPPQGDPTDPAKAWTSMLTRKYGLQWHQDFATMHGKPTAYSEWGIESDNAQPYIDAVHDWFASHNVVYQSIWNSNVQYQGQISEGQYPATAAEYKKVFGQ